MKGQREDETRGETLNAEWQVVDSVSGRDEGFEDKRMKRSEQR